MTTKRIKNLERADLDKRVTVNLGYHNETESGRLTDFYGGMDIDDNAVIAIELDDNLTFFLPPNSQIEISD